MPQQRRNHFNWCYVRADTPAGVDLKEDPRPVFTLCPSGCIDPQPGRGLLQHSWAGPSRKDRFSQSSPRHSSILSEAGVWQKGQVRTPVTMQEEQRMAVTRRCVVGKPEDSRAPSRADSCQGHCPGEHCVERGLFPPESFHCGRCGGPGVSWHRLGMCVALCCSEWHWLHSLRRKEGTVPSVLSAV